MERTTHELQQGSPEWHQFRATHFGASEASAMLGISPYKSRTDLLRERKTGIAKDVDASTQRVFDRGHEIEALARPMAEAVIGEDLFPVTMSYGKLSASCDGLTFDESIAWECKSSNKTDFEVVKNGYLPEKHWPQCEQVMLVTGAEKLLFTISDGTEEGTAHVWINADSELQDKVIAGWDQFSADLETFVPEPEVIPAKADPVMSLPSLAINVGGSISIQSNLDKFGERLKSFIEEANAKPETDTDFANLEQACKVLKDAEDALKQAESNALAQTASVDEMRRTVSFLADMARTNRLQFEKIVKSEKENRKSQIVSSAKNEFAAYCVRAQGDCPVILNITLPNFADAIKGKQKLDPMRDAVNTMLANAKIEADALARDLREKHAWYIENAGEYSFLFSDLQTLIYKDADSFQAVARNRILTHQEQEKAKAEAAAKAQAEREERIRREAEEKARREEQQRIAAEQAERERVEREAKQAAELIERKRVEAETKRQLEEKLAKKAEQEWVVGVSDTGEQDSGDQAQIVQAVDVLDNKEQDKQDIPVDDPTEKSPPRDQIIKAVAAKFFVTYDVAEAWLVKEFGELLVSQQAAA